MEAPYPRVLTSELPDDRGMLADGWPCTLRRCEQMTVSIHDLRAWKSDGKRWAMLTAYDFPTAQILDRAGIPVLLVGDSVGRNVLGYPNELPVTMEEMLHHTRAVARGAEQAMVVG